MSKRNYRTCLVGLLLLGVGLRLGAYLAVKNEPLTGDATEYAAVGRELYHGTYVHHYWPPLTGFVVAGCMHLIGPSLEAQRLAGLIPAVLAMPLIAALSCRCFGRRASLISTGILAVLPGQILVATEPQTESFVVFWIVAFGWMMRSWAGRPRDWLMLAIGGVIGLAGLTRAPLLFLGPACVLAIAMKHRSAPRRIVLPSALATLGALLVVLPWTYRNYRVSGTLILINSNGVRNIYHSNRIGSDRYLTYRAIYDDHGRYATEESKRLDGIPYPIVKMQLMRQAFRVYLREHPGDYVIRCLNRIRILSSWDLKPLARWRRSSRTGLSRLGLLAAGALHGFAILGLSGCAVAFLLRYRTDVAVTIAASLALLALPYVLISATPAYGMALHAAYIVMAGKILAHPRNRARWFWRRRRRAIVLILAVLYICACSAEWTWALYRAGSSLD